ncbi:Antigen MPT64 [Mycobacterium basiliense]|uniref:Antigen MPT64 n=1 Tax=Mycobacterium basiliense TaxID=2094119 RepID=A0A3S4CUC1_9MYCO|nr:esterase [Mycobacterium basiliense]VDM87931.1 Antigen MPT64 [Mycobacterium basiliense]
MRLLIATAVLAAAVLLAWPANAAPPSCASLGGSLEASQICHIHASGSTYTLDITFPVDYPDQQVLTDYITQNRDGFINVAKASGRRDHPYQMDATTEQHSAGQPPHNTRSVVLKFFQDLGGAHPFTWYKAFNYNIGAKQPITFDTLFVPGTSPLDTIFPIVQRELEHQTGLGVVILPSNGLDPTHYQNFAITDDDLIFYFAQGELLPSFAGATQVQVPRSAIPKLAI